MTIAQQVARVSSDIETRMRVGEFTALAPLLMLTKGDKLQAAEIAEARRLSARVAEVFRKSAVPVGNSRSDILVVQPAQHRHGQRLTDALDGTGNRRVLLQ